MIRRAILPALWCAAALAQLPPPQSAPPRPEPERKSKASTPEPQLLHVDVRAADLQGRAATGLTATDFTVETDGKPQKVEKCSYVDPHPLRVVLLVDDLSLSLQHLNAVKAALQKAVAELPPGHEFAIVRASGGDGVLEQFTADRALLSASLEPISYHPLQAETLPNAFQVGALGALQAVLYGLESVPGHKAVLLFSERLRDPNRARGLAREVTLKSAAARASAVVYAFDAVAPAEQAVMLDEGVAALAEDTGGRIFERGVEPADALARVLREQAGYYSLTFTAEGLNYNYLTRMPQVDRLVVKGPKALIVRAPKAPSASADAAFVAPGRELHEGVTSSFQGAGIRTRLTPVAGLESPSSLDAVLHVDARDIAFTRKADNTYHAELEVRAEVFGITTAAVQEMTRGISVKVSATTLPRIQDHGFDCKLTLNVPQPGLYQLRAAVADSHSSRLGSASQVLRIPDAGGGKLALSSIVLRILPQPSEPPPAGAQFLDENAPLRSFAAGSRIPYSYLVYNLHLTPEKRAHVEVRSQLYRDGVPIYTSEAKALDFDVPVPSKPAASGGFIALTAQSVPGRYTMFLTVTDKLAPGPAPATSTQTIDFQVRP
jgi:VWFA-related protein